MLGKPHPRTSKGCERNTNNGLNQMMDQEETQATSRGWPHKLGQAVARTLLGMGLLLTALWTVAALAFDVRVPWLRMPLVVIYVVTLLAVWIVVKRCWLAVGATAAGFALVLGWWLTLQPSNDRDWQPDVAVLPYAGQPIP